MIKRFSIVFVTFLFSNVFSNDFSDIIKLYSEQEGVDPLLVESIIYHESRGNVKALSHAGAMGIMQVMPDTARFVGINPSNLYTANQNIKAGILYLSFLKKHFNGNIEKMVAAYNAGHGAVIKYDGIPPYRETINYTKKVLASYSSYKKDIGVLKKYSNFINSPKPQFVTIVQPTDNSTYSVRKTVISHGDKKKDIRVVDSGVSILQQNSNSNPDSMFVQIVTDK